MNTSAMDHARAEELFSAYADGELPGAARTELEAHLAGCEGCRKELADFRATLDAMHGAVNSAGSTGPSPEFMNKLRTQINVRSRGRFFGGRRPGRGLEIASLVTLVIAVTVYVVLSLTHPLLLVR